MVSVKNLILLTVILFSLVACKKTVTQNSNSSIVGKWRLSEYLADPGDGSGTWHSAASLNPSYLEFKEDGTLSVSPYSVNSWDHFQVTSDSTIILFRGSDQFTRGYHFSTTLLTLSGGCTEACEERYIPAL
jgi:hypothetical protein